MNAGWSHCGSGDNVLKLTEFRQFLLVIKTALKNLSFFGHCVPFSGYSNDNDDDDYSIKFVFNVYSPNSSYKVSMSKERKQNPHTQKS